MQELIDLIARPETLTVTNVILAACIIFHLLCEFAHYIHEFWSHRKDGKQAKANGKMLATVIERIEDIERKCKNCKHKEDCHEKMDA